MYSQYRQGILDEGNEIGLHGEDLKTFAGHKNIIPARVTPQLGSSDVTNGRWHDEPVYSNPADLGVAQSSWPLERLSDLSPLVLSHPPDALEILLFQPPMVVQTRPEVSDADVQWLRTFMADWGLLASEEI